MANDFEYDAEAVARLKEWAAAQQLTDVERAFAEEHAANSLQAVALSYKLKNASAPTVRPVVVPVAMAVALAHAQHWERAATDGQPEYAYAEQARDQVEHIIRATAVTADERRFARELANECSMDVEAAYRGRPAGVPMRRLAVVVAFALAFQHADDWCRRNG